MSYIISRHELDQEIGVMQHVREIQLFNPSEQIKYTHNKIHTYNTSDENKNTNLRDQPT
jgi:hypothetical protein